MIALEGQLLSCASFISTQLGLSHLQNHILLNGRLQFRQGSSKPNSPRKPDSSHFFEIW